MTQSHLPGATRLAANDPVAIAPVLKKALSKGINVVGYDANATPDAREWFINQAEFNGIAPTGKQFTISGISPGGSCMSPSMSTTQSPRA